LCLFVLRPRPPRSPLFPYTTLFRSGKDGLRAAVAALLRRAARGISLDDEQLALGRIGRRAVGELAGQVEPMGDRGLARAILPRADRKSTRLNSSHRTISYAVFCLKK